MKKLILPSLLLLYFFAIMASPADDYLKQAEEYSISGNDIKEAEMLYKAGMGYWEESLPEKAIESFNSCITINSRIGNKNALLNLYTNIGMIYTDQNQLENALFAFRKSLKLREELGEKMQVVTGKLNIATALKQLQRNYEAISILEEALETAKQINNARLIRSCYGLLAESHKAVGEASESMEYYNLYATFDKKLQQDELKKKEAKAETRVAIAEQEKSRVKKEQVQTQKALQETEAHLYKSQLEARSQKELVEMKNAELLKRQEAERHERMMKTVYAVGFIIVLALASLVLFAYRKIRQKNAEITVQQQEIQKKNLAIKNSLNYAKKIQRAMLLPQSLLNEYLQDSFIFFSPREEVSGDFYYFSNPEFLRTGRATSDFSELLISAVDCTGHGVPGAFMSMIGYNLLDQIVGAGIVEPHLVLDRLHEGVYKALKQETTDNKDGMDMALLHVLREERIVEYAGAKNPLIYIQNGKLHEIKPNRYPVGGTLLRGRKPYEKQIVHCPSETVFYIYSDGFQDQFGGDNGRKFMAKKFKQLLLDIHRKPMNEQKDILSETLLGWRGNNHRQIDDILVMGFRF